MSFLKWNGIDPVKEFIGFENWFELLKDNIFRRALGNNFIIVILSIAIQLPIGMALAVLLDSGGRKLNLFKTVYFFPMLMSSVAVGILFKYVYDPQFGIVTAFLNAVGLKRLVLNWLGEPGVALYSVIAVICWQYIPFYMIYFLAAMTSIPGELFEAAWIDGATRGQYFWQIVLPLLKGTVRTAAILSLVGSLKYFDLIYVMTEGGPVNSTELMATYMYKNAFTTFRMGYGSTVAMALFLVVMVTSILVFSITKREERG
ncbi:carbohydrate ABC transporter permease [Petroclostridium xylanilyticum]|uniref:carbohydrate ABC transporter permease n=1 Tax=Petroclostridium xylanilyticum TaxID=1792311 RepID=UPI0018E37D17|nr:sugar ABC transporter permease [Petroclostridium xylanilyticum]